MARILVALLLFSNALPLTLQQSAELKKVEDSLLAPCCYTQSIAVHTSPVAAQMRQEVAEMVASGKSEAEIIGHYKALYGERILIIPDGSAGVVLFVLPVAVFLVSLGILLLFLRKMRGKCTASPPGPALAEFDPAWDAIRAEIERETGESI
ncbi:MAG TPA: cytochrome c-type biogenesis protein CcmH [Candidatus Solibacter sp.]|nr:cytochrome c-type biogenesis protein CcmH [Candidatus Solibacter sp.]